MDKKRTVVVIIDANSLLESDNFLEQDIKRFKSALLYKKSHNKADEMIVILKSLNDDASDIAKTKLNKIGIAIKNATYHNLKIYFDVSFNTKMSDLEDIDSCNTIINLKNRLKYETILSTIYSLNKSYDVVSVSFLQYVKNFSFSELYDSKKIINTIREMTDFDILVYSDFENEFIGMYNDNLLIESGVGFCGMADLLFEKQNINSGILKNPNLKRVELYSEDGKKRNFSNSNIVLQENQQQISSITDNNSNTMLLILDYDENVLNDIYEFVELQNNLIEKSKKMNLDEIYILIVNFTCPNIDHLKQNMRNFAEKLKSGLPKKFKCFIKYINHNTSFLQETTNYLVGETKKIKSQFEANKNISFKYTQLYTAAKNYTSSTTVLPNEVETVGNNHVIIPDFINTKKNSEEITPNEYIEKKQELYEDADYNKNNMQPKIMLFYETNDFIFDNVSDEEIENFICKIKKTAEIYNADNIYFCPIIDEKETTNLVNFASKINQLLKGKLETNIFIGDGIAMHFGEIIDFQPNANDSMSKILHIVSKMNNPLHIIYVTSKLNASEYIELAESVLDVESKLSDNGTFSLFILDSTQIRSEFGIFWDTNSEINGIINILNRINKANAPVYFKKKKEDDMLPF